MTNESGRVELTDADGVRRTTSASLSQFPEPPHSPDPPASQERAVDVIGTFADILRRLQPGEDFPELTPETTMEELGIDSVATMEILGYLEDEFDVVIPDEVLMAIRTVGDVERAVQSGTDGDKGSA